MKAVFIAYNQALTEAVNGVLGCNRKRLLNPQRFSISSTAVRILAQGKNKFSINNR
jgi:hypothetical protein